MFSYVQLAKAYQLLVSLFRGSITWGNQLFAFDVPYTTPILMDDVDCSGDESSLFNCTYTSDHNCQHYEDIGVICGMYPNLFHAFR